MALGAPLAWSTLTLDVWANVLAFEVAASAKDANGRYADETRLPGELTDRLVALRAEMYEPDRGAWLSARFVLHRDGDPEVAFNYDEDPGWSPELHPMMFVRDVEAFPRSVEHLTGWLRETVERGRTLQQEHDRAEP